MSLKVQIETAKTAAMKNKFAVKNESQEVKEQADLRLSTLKSLLVAIEAKEMSSKAGRVELTDAQVEGVIKTEVKKRLETSAIYEKAGVADRALTEATEATIAKEFLPAETTEAEIEAFVKSVIAEKNLAGEGKKGIGIVMGALKKEFANFDAAYAAKLVNGLMG